MIIHLIRHGETNFNILGLCNDNPAVDVHLTETGIAQARQMARELANESLDIILVSQLPRTRQTAEYINACHNVAIREESRLNDIRSGFDSKPVTQYFSHVGHDRLNIVPPGGESLGQFKQRTNSFIDSLISERLDNVLIVAHEETLRVFYARFKALADKDLDTLHFDNCTHLVFNVETPAATP